MYWLQIIIIPLFLQILCINSIDGSAFVRRRRQQVPVSMYGNSNLGANVQTGYNYPSNTNYYSSNLNNQGSKDFYGNSMLPSNSGGSLTNMGTVYNPQQQQQPQQQPQPYGPSGQPSGNPAFGGSSIYSGSGTNSVVRDPNTNMAMRDTNSNLSPAGPAGSPLYPSSNSQIGYPGNTNQMLTNRDPYNNVPSNANNNPYGLNNNAFPNNNNPYGGQMSMNSNANLWQPNNNNNNNNNPNPYNMNTGNAWSSNRDLNNVNNNNNPYSNMNLPYNFNQGYRMITSYSIVLSSFIILCFAHI